MKAHERERAYSYSVSVPRYNLMRGRQPLWLDYSVSLTDTETERYILIKAQIKHPVQQTNPIHTTLRGPIGFHIPFKGVICILIGVPHVYPELASQTKRALSSCFTRCASGAHTDIHK